MSTLPQIAQIEEASIYAAVYSACLTFTLNLGVATLEQARGQAEEEALAAVRSWQAALAEGLLDA